LIPAEQLDIWEASGKVLSGTGHRPNKLGDEYQLIGPITTPLREKTAQLIELLKPKKIISGMALGFDQILALAALELNIPLLAAVPCDDQERIWPSKSQELYWKILNNPLCETLVVSPGPYHVSKMNIRNNWMCDNSDALLAAWDGSSGGTANCVKYARKIGMNIFYIPLKEKKTSEETTLFDKTD